MNLFIHIRARSDLNLLHFYCFINFKVIVVLAAVISVLYVSGWDLDCTLKTSLNFDIFIPSNLLIEVCLLNSKWQNMVGTVCDRPVNRRQTRTAQIFLSWGHNVRETHSSALGALLFVGSRRCQTDKYFSSTLSFVSYFYPSSCAIQPFLRIYSIVSVKAWFRLTLEFCVKNLSIVSQDI